MINYNYKCTECGEVQEVSIKTIDILDTVGRVDMVKLDERIHEDKFCRCGGKLKKVITSMPDTLWFNEHKLKGKISQRYA